MGKDPEEFMEKMINSYDDVHNNRYWSQISPHIKQQAGGKVLDIGCGPGLLLDDLVNKFDSHQVYGIDLSEIMLKKAHEVLLKNSKEPEFHLIQQHMQEDASLPSDLDLVVSSRVLRSFDNILEVLNNIYGSLNDGGKLVILDWAQKSIRDYKAYFESTSEGHFEDLDPEDIVSYHRNFSIYGLDDWDYLLSTIGFDIEHSFAVNSVYNCIIGSK